MTFASTAAQAAARAQSLGITLHRNDAATARLAHYHAAAPIAVNVGGKPVRHLSEVTATAHGPGGATITAPLVRDGSAFSGKLRLASPGAWIVDVSAQLGSVNAPLATIPLDVVNEDPADVAAGIAFALSACCIAGGVLLIARTRRRHADEVAS